MDFVRRWSEKTEIRVGRFIAWLGVTVSKFYNWRQRYGRVNEHNGWVPRDFWLEPWEKEAIVRFPSEESVGRLSPADVHDVRSRCGGRESGERMARAETSGTAVALESEAVAQRDRLRTAAAAAPALACRCFLYQSVGHVLLLRQRAGWVQSSFWCIGICGSR